MMITLTHEMEAALQEQARKRGMTPEAVVIDALRDQLYPEDRYLPRDDWERRLRSIGKDHGVSLPPEALTSEGIYE